jgi:hypothetical protein
LSSPDVRRDSAGDIKPEKLGTELTVLVSGLGYGGGGPEYMDVGLIGAVDGMLRAASDGCRW